MTDISQLRQIIKEINKLKQDTIMLANEETAKRFDYLTALILSTDEAKSIFNQEVNGFKKVCDRGLNFRGHVSIPVSMFYGYTFPPKYYIDRLIEIYNSMDGYKAHFAEYSKHDVLYEDALYISKES